MEVNYFVDKEVDLNQLFALYKDIGWITYLELGEKVVLQFIKKSHHNIQVFQNDKLIGFGRTFSDGALYVFLQDVIVAPKYQRKGIGTKIVKQLLEMYADFPRKDYILLFSQAGAEGFYDKLGFKRCSLQVFQLG